MTGKRATPAAFTIDRVWKVYGGAARGLPDDAAALPSVDELRRRGLSAAVEDASFEILRNETFVIMGLSGSGKSTLLRCLCGLIPVTAGSVLLDGQDLTRITAGELRDVRRHKLGMVFQNYALLPHRTVVDNICLPLEVRGATARERLDRAAALIRLVGLDGKEAVYPAQLSGGQQQRVGIARSLANDPEIWLLDEPFSALDPLIRRELQDELIRLQRQMRKTVVFITHDFDEAARLASRIAIMRDGRIVQVGTPEELVLAPATPYVADFTRSVDRGMVLTARAIMDAGLLAAEGVEPVPARARLESFARRILELQRPVAVVDEHAKIVGRVTPQAVLAALLPERAEQPAPALTM